ncbi:MAG: GNAT family N-acetyltransferase [Rickettsiales bacterium]|nr:GNAT family N-acetyltransferase [Rickettsiales bacterium]
MKIIQVTSEHLSLAAPLFNAYRMFYEKESDLKNATKFLRDRIANNESAIFIALDEKSEALGLMQLYPGFSSVGMKKIYILNDLYIDEKSRGQGIGRRLMKVAQDFAILNSASKISLQTAKTNKVGQDLYESEGYVLDDEYLTYVLTL